MDDNDVIIEELQSNLTEEIISKQNEEDDYLNNVLLEQIVKFIKTDDLIQKKNKEHRDNIKQLKTVRNEMEDYLIRYMKKINFKHINVKQDKGNINLVVSDIKRRGGININNIRESVIGILRKEKLVQSEEQINRLISNLLDTIDKNRKVSVKTVIKKEK